MDIKLGGISQEVLKEALNQAKEGRNHILNLMEEANANIVINEEILPKLEIFEVSTDKIPDIIGQGGKTIKEIIEKYGVEIDLDREKGEVKISSPSAKNTKAAKEYILDLVSKEGGRGFKKGRREEKNVHFDIGEEFFGEVKNVAKFGAFISLRDGVDGLLHISKIKIPLLEGDIIKVKVAELKGNKISLDLAE